MLSALMLMLLLTGLPASAQSPVRIRIGTAAPDGSIWDEVIEQMANDWRRIAGDRLNVIVYAGTQGDEARLLDRIRIGSLEAAGLSGAGLAQADPGVSALLVPMLFESWEELDYVRAALEPTLEERLRARGLIVLNWGDIGWVHIFSREPVRTPDDLRSMRLFISDGDPETERLYDRLGFDPVPASVTDMVTNLRTGVIDAFAVPPLFALADQSFPLAPNMLALRWVPLIGATLIRQETWEQIPEDLRPRLLQAAGEATERRSAEIRETGETAIDQMRGYGLQVTPIDEATRASWEREIEAAWPELRGGMVPADLFDRARELVEEFRARN
jgi:TRAP-type C4-dicarboxylate transport system substrate-binding protein